MGLAILFVAAALLVIALGTWATLHRLAHPPRATFAVALARRQPTSPADVGLAFAQRTLRLSDGASTPAWVAEGLDPGGPVVIVTHGWGDSRYGGLLWGRLLAPHAAAIVTYDLRGHGESETPASHLGTTEVQDLLALVEQVEIAGRPVVLMGASMGAGISIAAAAEAGERVAGVIADSAYRHGLEPIAGYFRLQRWPVQPFMLLVGAHLACWYQAPGAFDRARLAARLECPLLVLHGADDPICPADSARQIAAAAPRGKLVCFEDGGHLDLAAADEARYGEALREFFAAAAAGGPKMNTDTRREDETRRREMSRG